MFVSPNPTYALLHSLESLSELASSPLSLTERQLEKARAFIGLLLLYLVDPSLSADFYAMMTCARIPLQGDVERKLVRGRRRPVHILPDPDATRRKSLRRFLDRLTKAHILRKVQTQYAIDSLNPQSATFLDHPPPAGTICWNGLILVKKKPKGEKTDHVYALAGFETAQYPNDILSQFIEPDRVDSTIRETCLQELQTLYNSLQKIQRANRLDIERTMAMKLEPVVRAPPESKKITQIAYVLTSFARPRGLVKLLPSAVRLALAQVASDESL